MLRSSLRPALLICIAAIGCGRGEASMREQSRSTVSAPPIEDHPRVQNRQSGEIKTFGQYLNKTTGGTMAWPDGWTGTGVHADRYRMTSEYDREGRGYHGLLGSLEPTNESGIGVLMQQFSANKYLSRTLHFRGELHATDVSDKAMLWIGVDDGCGRLLELNNGIHAIVQGTTGWTQRDVAIRVPVTASAITIGIELHGGGEVRVRKLALEAERTESTSELSPSAQTDTVGECTKLFGVLPDAPTNLAMLPGSFGRRVYAVPRKRGN